MNENGKTRGSVLVVEDNPAVLALIEDCIEDLGIKVLTAASKGDGLRLLRNRTFDIAILDVYLPDGTGFELAQEIKRSAPATFVIIVTGQPSSQNIQQSLDNDVDAFLMKPLEVSRLIPLVEGVMKERGGK